jgi:hypothetical protein
MQSNPNIESTVHLLAGLKSEARLLLLSEYHYKPSFVVPYAIPLLPKARSIASPSSLAVVFCSRDF